MVVTDDSGGNTASIFVPEDLCSGFNQDQSMWDLWWMKWHLDRCFSENFGFFLSASFHSLPYIHLFIYVASEIGASLKILLCVQRFFLTQQLPVDQVLLIIESTQSHPDTPHSIGLLWTSDQSVAETSTWQHTTLTTDIHPCPRGILNQNLKQASGHRSTP